MSDRAFVYWCVPDTAMPSSTHAGLLALLSSAEREQFGAFKFDRDRFTYLAAHVLLRRALSEFADVRPDHWTFSKSTHGRPEVSGPISPQGLRFNLSHTDGLVACIVHSHVDCGIDVEHINRGAQSHDVADRFFSSRELKALKALTPAEQRERFIRLWTLKEAYIKARGLGLSLALERFGFDLDGDEPHLFCETDIDANPDQWQFRSFHPTPKHVMSVALGLQAGPPVNLVLRHRSHP